MKTTHKQFTYKYSNKYIHVFSNNAYKYNTQNDTFIGIGIQVQIKHIHIFTNNIHTYSIKTYSYISR